jgi:hypothetical protein
MRKAADALALARLFRRHGDLEGARIMRAMSLGYWQRARSKHHG